MQTGLYPSPYKIEFPRIGELQIGYISVAEELEESIPFAVQRVFWTYYTPQSIQRGHHAHYETQEVLVAVAGRIVVTTEMPDGSKESFVMDRPWEGLYIPPQAWKIFEYSHTAVQLVLASNKYDEGDYIRDYDAFRAYYS